MFPRLDVPAGEDDWRLSDEYPAGLVVNYISCPDINESMAAIEEAGGKVIMPAVEVPGVGQVSMFTDPSGNTLGLLQPASEM